MQITKVSRISRLINIVNFLRTYPKQKVQNKKWNTICMFVVVVKLLAATSLTFKCIRSVLSVLFHSFSFCWFMLYNRLGRRRTFAMYTKSSAWMNDCFRSFKGFSLRISSLGSRAWWIGLLLAIIHFKLFFKHLKILPFFLPPPSIMSINISPCLPPPPPK